MRLETANRILTQENYNLKHRNVVRIAAFWIFCTIIWYSMWMFFSWFVQAKEVQLHLEQIEQQEVKTEYLWEWVITAYYSPLKADWMNCSWDCRTTASWHKLKDEEAGYVVACPKSIPFWTRLHIEWMDHDVWCRDRWGAIKWERLDLWVWGADKRQYALNYWIKLKKVYIVY
jgi:hypothetical protein